MGVISFNEHIYVCGGWDGPVDEFGLETVDKELRYCNSLERYTIKTDSWRTLSYMRFKRRNFSIVALGNYLYAIGGLLCGRVVEQVMYES